MLGNLNKFSPAASSFISFPSTPPESSSLVFLVTWPLISCFLRSILAQDLMCALQMPASAQTARIGGHARHQLLIFPYSFGTWRKWQGRYRVLSKKEDVLLQVYTTFEKSRLTLSEWCVWIWVIWACGTQTKCRYGLLMHMLMLASFFIVLSMKSARECFSGMFSRDTIAKENQMWG